MNSSLNANEDDGWFFSSHRMITVTKLLKNTASLASFFYASLSLFNLFLFLFFFILTLSTHLVFSFLSKSIVFIHSQLLLYAFARYFRILKPSFYSNSKLFFSKYIFYSCLYKHTHTHLVCERVHSNIHEKNLLLRLLCASECVWKSWTKKSKEENVTNHEVTNIFFLFDK